MNEVMSETDTPRLRAIFADTWQYTAPLPSRIIRLTQEEVDAVALISGELQAYVEQMEVKCIIGELDIDTGWEDFQEHLRSIGVEEYVEVHRGASARYLEIAENLQLE